jgi:nucleotide-binding universal stress UspA family protein
MYQKILVPVDVNQLDKANEMLETAQKMGGDKTEIILAHIIEAIPNYVAVQIPSEYLDAARKETHDALSKLANAINGTTEIDIRTGHAGQGILAIADEKNVDAIVLASHRPGIEDYFLGSTASRVVRHAKCTVVVIR